MFYRRSTNRLAVQHWRNFVIAARHLLARPGAAQIATASPGHEVQPPAQRGAQDVGDFGAQRALCPLHLC